MPGHRLVLVTLNPHGVDLDSRIRELGLQRHVISTGYVPHQELNSIYAAADALVIPAIYETTSLPAIEAQAAGAPVVCIDSAGMREVTGSISSRFACLEVDLVAEAMLRVAVDDTYRRRLSEEGLENATQFSWKRTARETLNLLLEVAR